MPLDTDNFHTTRALLAACDRQVAVANAALMLLALMDGAGDHGAEGLFDDSRKSVADSLHDVVRVDCLALGNIAKRAGYAIGDELHALGRQLDVDWTAKFDAARMAAAVMVAAR